MRNVISFEEWRARLDRSGLASTRRTRLNRVRKGTPVTGTDLSAELRRLLSLE